MAALGDEDCDFLRNGLQELGELDRACSRFLDCMRHSSAFELVQRVKSFVNTFMATQATAAECSQLAKSFVEEMSQVMCEHPLWRDEGEERVDLATEALERHLMHRLHKVAFHLPSTSDSKDDKEFFHRVRTLQFLRPEHIDIPERPLNQVVFEMAAEELSKLDLDCYKSPREKLTCILNCITILTNFLKHYKCEQGTGADDVLPYLIYTVLLLSPRHMHSNLRYIKRFRRECEFQSEAAYYFTQMESAVMFITEVTHESLSISEEDFKTGVQKMEEMIRSGVDISSFISLIHKPRHKTSPPRKQKTPASSDHRELFKTESQLHSIPESLDVESSQLTGEESTQLTALDGKEDQPEGNTESRNSTHIHEIDPECITVKFLTSRFEELTVADLQELHKSYKSLVQKHPAPGVRSTVST